MRVSRLAASVADSITLALDGRAKALIAAGHDVINMGVGEPDFPAPAAARHAAAARIASGDVRYTPAAGIRELREAIARELARTRGAPWVADQVAVCHSAKHALSLSLLAVVDPGDEVLVPLPAWVSYLELVRIAGGVPVPVPPAPGCRPDLDAIAAAVGPRTRGVILGSPCNPSGVVLDARELARLGELAVRHDLWLLSDEIYRRLVYDGAEATSPASIDPSVRERTLVVDGASKVYAMTGYRIGFAAGPVDAIDAVARLASQMTGSPNAVSQAAYLAALESEPPEIARMVAELDGRRRLLVGGLRGLELELPEPRGAFYAFPDVSPWLDGRGARGFCEDLLRDELVSAVPGGAFGLEGHVRFSYALDVGRIERALERLARFLAARRARIGSG